MGGKPTPKVAVSFGHQEEDSDDDWFHNTSDYDEGDSFWRDFAGKERGYLHYLPPSDGFLLLSTSLLLLLSPPPLFNCDRSSFLIQSPLLLFFLSALKFHSLCLYRFSLPISAFSFIDLSLHFDGTLSYFFLPSISPSMNLCVCLVVSLPFVTSVSHS